MKNIEVDGFCYGDSTNHKKCYFCKENKFCGLWMRNISGVFNPKKRMFKCTFCNPSTVTIDSKIGPSFIEDATENASEGRFISF